MLFDHVEPLDLSDVPRFSIGTFRTEIVRQVAGGWRMAAYLGIPADGGTTLLCLLANDGERSLSVLASEPVASYPALTPECPQAHLFERELHETSGVMPEGHPWLKPVRFVRRPDGTRPGPAEMPFFRISGSQVHEVAVGPVHAGVIEPGHFRFQCHGETVLHLEIALGFQHRGVERLLVGPASARTLPLVECACGDSSVAHATAFSLLVERLAGIAVPAEAAAARCLALELERLANHTGDLGAIGGDTGFLPTSAWNGRIRGDFLNITALFCGNRFGRGMVVPGGVGRDLEPARCEEALGRLRAAYRDVRGSVDVMLDSGSVRNRLRQTGTVSLATARDLGMVGMAARASGLAVDARHGFPASADLPAAPVRVRTSGDVLARTLVRSDEVDDSAAICEEALRRLSAGPAAATPATLPALPPNAMAVGIAEGWRGEVVHVGLTDAKGLLSTVKIVDPSFHNWAGLAMAMRNQEISDFPLCNKSFNLSYCGHDL